MKKNLFIIALMVLLSGQLFAQIPPTRTRAPQTPAALPPPLATREVSGVIKDQAGETIVGATVTLNTTKDTLRTATNNDGIFIFKNVKEATFFVTVTALGTVPLTRKYLNNDAVKHIVLDPIELKTQDNILNEVVIDGKPSIVYKTDTVEFKASDYKVRPNATVDEVLKKMEGVEVGTDGSVTFQGQQVTKAKLNGKEYAGGGVAQAIQNLPADIAEKLQFVDDYGDLAAKTGVKDGEPQKILNITTKADKSVGTTARLTAQYGSNDRYNAQLFAQRINANQQLGIIGNLRNTINGVSNDGTGGGSTGGTTKSGSPSFNYRDQWSKKTQVVGSYVYNFSDNTSLNQSYGQRFTSLGNSVFNDRSDSKSDSKGHRVNFEITHDIDSANFLQITPSYSYNSSTSQSNSVTDNINNYRTGFEHRLENAINSNTSSSSNYGVNAFYLHVFKKPQRNISIQFNLTHSSSLANTDRNTITKNFQDSTQNFPLLTTQAHILTDRDNKNTSYTTTATYVEPLSKTSQLQLVGQLRHADYDNSALSDSVLANGTIQRNPLMDNVYNYAITETRASLNYRYNGTKYNFSLGAAVVPYISSGARVNPTGGPDIEISRSYTKIIPVLRFSYIWSRTERLQLTYTGRNNEPNFSQLQPFTDRSNPNNIIIGNPDLKPTFTNTVNTTYNNYLANSKLSLALSVNATLYDNQVSTNVLPKQIALPGGGSKNTQETYYVNINGSKEVTGNYTIAKSFSNRKYSVSLNGTVGYNYNNAMFDNQLYHTTSWNISQRFGPQINPTEWFEINPFYEYRLSRTFSTSANANATTLQTNSFVLTGRVYFLKTFQINYRASKSYVTGLGNLNTNPLIINAGFEKEFFERRTLAVTFNVFDLLHQNNFIQQTVTSQGVTNTLSNNLSRYFLVGIRLNLQKWSGRPQRGGINMQRRGDGSFIYN
jgi:outer membrane receptor protein involved in Fe transport